MLRVPSCLFGEDACLELATLSLFAESQSLALPLGGEWRIKSAHEGEGLAAGYADPNFDDSNWEVIRLPHLRHATAEQDTLWYRARVDLAGLAKHPVAKRSGRDLLGLGRILLRFGGSFYRTRVWLNGVYLGSHEGYFQPFGFDVTELLRPAGNLLAVRCRFPVEAGAFKRKTAVAGVFADWDCKPYPSQYYPDLPAPNEWTVPLGLWQPAALQPAGPVIVESFNVLPKVIGADWERGRAEAAKLRCVAVMRNLTGELQRTETRLEVTPLEAAPEMLRPFRDQAGGEWTISLEGSERREFDFNLTLREPRLWFPWTHGQPNLYQARLTISNSLISTLRPSAFVKFTLTLARAAGSGA